MLSRRSGDQGPWGLRAQRCIVGQSDGWLALQEGSPPCRLAGRGTNSLALGSSSRRYPAAWPLAAKGCGDLGEGRIAVLEAWQEGGKARSQLQCHGCHGGWSLRSQKQSSHRSSATLPQALAAVPIKHSSPPSPGTRGHGLATVGRDNSVERKDPENRPQECGVREATSHLRVCQVLGTNLWALGRRDKGDGSVSRDAGYLRKLQVLDVGPLKGQNLLPIRPPRCTAQGRPHSMQQQRRRPSVPPQTGV